MNMPNDMYGNVGLPAEVTFEFGEKRIIETTAPAINLSEARRQGIKNDRSFEDQVSIEYGIDEVEDACIGCLPELGKPVHISLDAPVVGYTWF